MATAFSRCGAGDEDALRAAGARYLARHADAARHLAPHLDRLIGGIALVPFLEPGGPFGPAWAGHALASPAMRVGYRLREPDLTRELAAVMGPAAGHQGRHRAVGFLRLITDLAGAMAVRETLTDDVRPTVSAELPVPVTRARLTDSDAPSGRAPAASRIDLLFEWPLNASGRQAVVVIEAKLGAGVADGQLRPYRAEALRRARGGPVGLILLTGRPDPAERRHRAWTALRWPAPAAPLGDRARRGWRRRRRVRPPARPPLAPPAALSESPIVIAVPESVAFYRADPVNRAAVNVLAGVGEVAPDRSLAEAARYEAAQLAARRVRLDYVGLLRSLWSASWEAAVRSHLPGARLLTYGEHQAFRDAIDPMAEPSLDGAWEARAVCGVFDLPRHGRLLTRLALVEEDGEGQLLFYLIDAAGGCAVSDALELGPDWVDDGANRRHTRPGLSPVWGSEGGIDPAPLGTLATAAITALAAALA